MEMTNIKGQNFNQIPPKPKTIRCPKCGWALLPIPGGYVCTHCEYKSTKKEGGN